MALPINQHVAQSPSSISPTKTVKPSSTHCLTLTPTKAKTLKSSQNPKTPPLMASLTRALTSSSRPQLLNLLLLLRSNPKLTPFTARSMTTMTTFPATNPESESIENFLPFKAGNDTMKYMYLTGGPLHPCSMKCEEAVAYARVDLPGITKEGVKMWVQDDYLVVNAEEEKKKKKKESEGLGLDEKARKYEVVIDISEKSYEKEKIRAVMENGVLNVVIPLIKPEDEEGAFKIKVE